jgi:hypothetical protein
VVRAIKVAPSGLGCRLAVANSKNPDVIDKSKGSGIETIPALLRRRSSVQRGGWRSPMAKPPGPTSASRAATREFREPMTLSSRS